jgi:hypothetical protein
MPLTLFFFFCLAKDTDPLEDFLCLPRKGNWWRSSKVRIPLVHRERSRDERQRGEEETLGWKLGACHPSRCCWVIMPSWTALRCVSHAEVVSYVPG